MKCLVVGGTGWLGGTIVEAALAAGHVVTTLSRGVTDCGDKPGVKRIMADRYDRVPDLADEGFDVVFDTSAYTPDAVTRILDAVGDNMGRYVLVSSVSVYGDYSTPRLNEDVPAPEASEADYRHAATVPPHKRADGAAYGPAYGPLKRACEVAAVDRLGERLIVLRPGLIVGPGDKTDRLTWWVRRIDQGGRVPVPGPMDRPIQMIDVRDLADFAVHAAMSGLSGIYNVTGRDVPMHSVIDAMRAVSGTTAEIVWVAEKKMEAAGIEPWSELPLITPPIEKFRYFLQISTEKAERSGLRLRPLSTTLSDLLEWDRQRRDRTLACGIDSAKENALLE